MPDGGNFISSFKTSLTRTFNSVAKTSFEGDSIRNCLDGFVSVKVKVGQFSNQAKTALANKEAGTATSAAISQLIKNYNRKYPDNFNTVVEILTKFEKAEAAADKARLAVMTAQNELNNAKRKKVLLSDKLKDAEELGEDAILLICEGNSAAASMAVARDTKHYGILPIRGKIINLLSNTMEDAMANEEVKAILMALGCGMLDKYDSKKLRYGKVGICVDADDKQHCRKMLFA